MKKDIPCARAQTARFSHVGLMQFDDIVRLFCRNEIENRGSLKQPFQPP